MTIYNFNLLVGYNSNGVDFAQVYRNNAFKKIDLDYKFVYTDLMRARDVEYFKSIGIDEANTISVYKSFTDIDSIDLSVTLKDVVSSLNLDNKVYEVEYFSDGQCYNFYQDKLRINVVYKTGDKNIVNYVEYIYDEKLVVRDFYRSSKFYSEYFAPFEDDSKLYKRVFYNKDLSIAFTEYVQSRTESTYYFEDGKKVYSKQEFIEVFIKNLKLKKDDVIIIDRDGNFVQPILKFKGESKVGAIIHQEHYLNNYITEDYIQWNNIVQYQLSHANLLDFIITSTNAQKDILQKQLKKYFNYDTRVVSISAGNITELKYPEKERRKNSFVTVSRLSNDKKIDWIIKAVVKAKKQIPDIVFDIYGHGECKEEYAHLIKDYGAEDYIILKGFQNVKEIYKQYSYYISASTGETFGLSLMEAAGSGLALLGFDVPYGNSTFIKDNENGYLMPFKENDSVDFIVETIYNYIIKISEANNFDKFSKKSYELATEFLTENVGKRWKKTIEWKKSI